MAKRCTKATLILGMQGREMIHYFEVSSCSLKLCIMFFATAAKPKKW